MKNTYAKDIAFSVKNNKKALKLCLPGAFSKEIDFEVRICRFNFEVQPLSSEKNREAKGRRLGVKQLSSSLCIR